MSKYRSMEYYAKLIYNLSEVEAIFCSCSLVPSSQFPLTWKTSFFFFKTRLNQISENFLKEFFKRICSLRTRKNLSYDSFFDVQSLNTEVLKIF